MHLNNVTVAEVEANGRLLVNKAADYLSEIEARKKHTTFNIQESSSRQVRYFLYRKCTRRGGVSLLLTRPVIPIATQNTKMARFVLPVMDSEEHA